MKLYNLFFLFALKLSILDCRAGTDLLPLIALDEFSKIDSETGITLNPNFPSQTYKAIEQKNNPSRQYYAGGASTVVLEPFVGSKKFERFTFFMSNHGITAKLNESGKIISYTKCGFPIGDSPSCDTISPEYCDYFPEDITRAQTENCSRLFQNALAIENLITIKNLNSAYHSQAAENIDYLSKISRKEDTSPSRSWSSTNRAALEIIKADQLKATGMNPAIAAVTQPKNSLEFSHQMQTYWTRARECLRIKPLLAPKKAAHIEEQKKSVPSVTAG